MTRDQAKAEAARRWPRSTGYPLVVPEARGRRGRLPFRVGVTVYKMGGPAAGLFRVKGEGDSWEAAFADAAARQEKGGPPS